MSDKNSKVLERLAFAAGIKVEDLKAAIISLSSEPKVEVSDLKSRLSHVMKKVYSPSPLFANTGRPSYSRETAVFKAIDFISFGWNWTETFPTYNVNAKKRTVVCLIRNTADNKIVSKGIAKCNPNDCFNEYIGQAIALSRATDIPVPEYLLDVPQPDHKDIQKGDIIKFPHAIPCYTVLDVDTVTDNMEYEANGKRWKAHANFKDSLYMGEKIINDTGRYKY